MDIITNTLLVHTTNHTRLLQAHHLPVTMTETHLVTLVVMRQGVMVSKTRRIPLKVQLALLLEEMSLCVVEHLLEYLRPCLSLHSNGYLIILFFLCICYHDVTYAAQFEHSAELVAFGTSIKLR